MLIRLICAALALSAAAAVAQPLEFKGIAPGVATAADALARYPGAEERTDMILAIMSAVTRTKCGPPTYSAQPSECERQVRDSFSLPGGYHAEYISFDLMSKSGIIGAVQITFTSSIFALMKDAISAKYGPPTKVETELLRNRLGAEFTSEIASWSRPDGTIVLRQRYGRIDSAQAEFMTHDMPAKREEDWKRRARDGASKL